MDDSMRALCNSMALAQFRMCGGRMRTVAVFRFHR
jgi:hypothetical protein